VTTNHGPTTFLGTGAGDFYTGLDKPGDIGGKDLRHAPSLFIAPHVMVDFHDDTQLAGFGISPDSVRHLLITHCHYDHFQPVRIHAFARKLSHPLEVYGSGTAVEALDFACLYEWDDAAERFTRHGRRSNVEPVQVETGAAFTADDLTVTPVHAHHLIDKQHHIMGERALNYVFQRRGRTMFYGIDSCSILPGTLEALAGFRFDIAVLDATWASREIDLANTGHMNWRLLDEACEQLRSSGSIDDDTKVIADHLSVNTVGPYAEIAGPLQERGITLAYDGMTVDF